LLAIGGNQRGHNVKVYSVSDVKIFCHKHNLKTLSVKYSQNVSRHLSQHESKFNFHFFFIMLGSVHLRLLKFIPEFTRSTKTVRFRCRALLCERRCH
jgi:hypothetical protein